MDQPLAQIYQSLQKLITLHRQLLEVVRLERVALVAADVKGIQEHTLAMQLLLESIRQAETERLRGMSELSALWRKPIAELTLENIVLTVQAADAKGAEQFRSSWNALKLLIARITEQNSDNRALVARSLAHVETMKRNVLGEAQPRSGTYSPSGQRTTASSGARLISKEV